MKKIVFIILVSFFFSCETEEQKKKKAQEVVQALISNIQIDNYKSIYEYYPSFRELVGKYWKYSSIEITSTILKEDGTVEIFAKANSNDHLYFVLGKVNSNYMVLKSKGLSSYFNSNLYKYCKNIGCIGINEYDIDIGKICKEKESDFNFLVNRIKNKIEDNFRLENHSLRRNGGWGLTPYVSGDIIVKNYSRFTIPRYSYDIYIKFLNNKDKEVYKFNYSSNFSDIPFNSSEKLHIFETVNNNYKKVGIDLVILNSSFIEDIIAEYAEGSLCNYVDNL